MKLVWGSFLFFVSCFSGKENSVVLFKQWHLSPDTNTRDVEASTRLGQYQNQMYIYKNIKKMIKEEHTKLIIAEGCEGEIDKNFSHVYNGWSMTDLIQARQNKQNFSKIMAPIGMKLKAEFPALKVLCGDNLELINENLKAMSDLRGFAGFYSRLVENHGKDQKKFKAYSDQLRSLYPNENIQAPIQFSLERALKALKTFERIIYERNRFFVKLGKEKLKQNPVIIIGGLHVENLSERFKVENIKSHTIIPIGYIDNETLLINTLKKKLEEGSLSLFHFFQVPAGFDIKLFPFRNKISEVDIGTVGELSYLKEIIEKKIPTDLLFSDYDQDGIRDFTLSRNGEQVIISAEDDDWDGDGVDNINDSDVGDVKIASLEPIKIENHYFSQSSVESIQESLEKKLVLISQKDQTHELLVLEVLNQLLTKFSKQNYSLKYVVASVPRFSYGQSVFFTYVSQSKSLEYYPQKLITFLSNEYETKFKGVQFNKFVNSYVIPLLIHSIAHELAHTLLFDNLDNLARKNGWDWKDTPYQGLYLKSHRMQDKMIVSTKTHLLYRGKAYKDWMKDNEIYVNEVNLFLKEKNPKQKKEILIKSHYKMNNSSSEDEHKISFLNKNKVVSLYSLSNPSEWFAESYAMCVFRKIYPESSKKLRSIEIEHLLGINPLGISTKFCQNFNL